MKKILFLDDNENRHKTIKPHLLHDEAYTAQEAIQKLGKTKYDVVFLDHDLGGQEMVDSFSREETGYTVAKWIVENNTIIPLVIVHSINPAGSENISALLRANGYNVIQIGFPYLIGLVDKLLT